MRAGSPREEARTGFTLIELLVVIAIIGLLASIVLASLNGARQKGRDARRLADAKEIATALELYYSDYKQYPSGVDSNPADNGWDDATGDGFITGLTGSNVRGDNPNGTVYMSSVPSDPQGNKVNNVCQAGEYAYETLSNRQTYLLVMKPEASSLGNIPDCGICSGIYDICYTPDGWK